MSMQTYRTEGATIHALLVEDNPADVELTTLTLKRSKIILDMDIVHDGEEALKYLFKEDHHSDVPTPDIVLLDLNIPRVNGIDVLKKVKSTPSTAHIPIIILSSSESEIDILKSYKEKANCYLTKPLGLKEFETLVKSIENFWFSVVKLPPK